MSNPFRPGTGKARLLDALRRGDVDAYAFAPVHGQDKAFDGHDPIGRLAPRVEELRNKYGYVIDDVAGDGVGHSVYRLVSEPSSPGACVASVRADGAGAHRPSNSSSTIPEHARDGVRSALAGGSGGPPAPQLHAAAGIAAGLAPIHPERSRWVDDDDGDDAWITEAA